MPDAVDPSMVRRTFLRVPLGAQRDSAMVVLVQLTHSHLGKNALNKNIQMFAAARNAGRAAAASMRGAAYHVVPVTMGDQNLTQDDVVDNHFSQSLVKHAFLIAASEGVVDTQGRRHQDLIVVDADLGVTRLASGEWTSSLKLAPTRCDVISFDGSHQAVQACLCREPAEAAMGTADAAQDLAAASAAAPAATTAEAAQAAAPTRGTSPDVAYAAEDLAAAPASPAGMVLEDVFETDSSGSEADHFDVLLDVMYDLPTGADIVRLLDREAQFVAAFEEDETTLADFTAVG